MKALAVLLIGLAVIFVVVIVVVVLKSDRSSSSSMSTQETMGLVCGLCIGLPLLWHFFLWLALHRRKKKNPNNKMRSVHFAFTIPLAELAFSAGWVFFGFAVASEEKALWIGCLLSAFVGHLGHALFLRFMSKRAYGPTPIEHWIFLCLLPYCLAWFVLGFGSRDGIPDSSAVGIMALVTMVPYAILFCMSSADIGEQKRKLVQRQNAQARAHGQFNRETTMEMEESPAEQQRIYRLYGSLVRTKAMAAFAIIGMATGVGSFAQYDTLGAFIVLLHMLVLILLTLFAASTRAMGWGLVSAATSVAYIGQIVAASKRNDSDYDEEWNVFGARADVDVAFIFWIGMIVLWASAALKHSEFLFSNTFHFFVIWPSILIVSGPALMPNSPLGYVTGVIVMVLILAFNLLAMASVVSPLDPVFVNLMGGVIGCVVFGVWDWFDIEGAASALGGTLVFVSLLWQLTLLSHPERMADAPSSDNGEDGTAGGNSSSRTASAAPGEDSTTRQSTARVEVAVLVNELLFVGGLVLLWFDTDGYVTLGIFAAVCIGRLVAAGRITASPSAACADLSMPMLLLVLPILSPLIMFAILMAQDHSDIPDSSTLIARRAEFPLVVSSGYALLLVVLHVLLGTSPTEEEDEREQTSESSRTAQVSRRMRKRLAQMLRSSAIFFFVVALGFGLCVSNIVYGTLPGLLAIITFIALMSTGHITSCMWINFVQVFLALFLFNVHGEERDEVNDNVKRTGVGLVIYGIVLLLMAIFGGIFDWVLPFPCLNQGPHHMSLRRTFHFSCVVFGVFAANVGFIMILASYPELTAEEILFIEGWMLYLCSMLLLSYTTLAGSSKEAPFVTSARQFKWLLSEALFIAALILVWWAEDHVGTFIMLLISVGHRLVLYIFEIRSHPLKFEDEVEGERDGDDDGGEIRAASRTRVRARRLFTETYAVLAVAPLVVLILILTNDELRADGNVGSLDNNVAMPLTVASVVGLVTALVILVFSPKRDNETIRRPVPLESVDIDDSTHGGPIDTQPSSTSAGGRSTSTAPRHSQQVGCCTDDMGCICLCAPPVCDSVDSMCGNCNDCGNGDCDNCCNGCAASLNDGCEHWCAPCDKLNGPNGSCTDCCTECNYLLFADSSNTSSHQPPTSNRDAYKQRQRSRASAQRARSHNMQQPRDGFVAERLPHGMNMVILLALLQGMGFGMVTSRYTYGMLPLAIFVIVGTLMYRRLMLIPLHLVAILLITLCFALLGSGDTRYWVGGAYLAWGGICLFLPFLEPVFAFLCGVAVSDPEDNPLEVNLMGASQLPLAAFQRKDELEFQYPLLKDLCCFQAIGRSELWDSWRRVCWFFAHVWFVIGGIVMVTHVRDGSAAFLWFSLGLSLYSVIWIIVTASMGFYEQEKGALFLCVVFSILTLVAALTHEDGLNDDASLGVFIGVVIVVIILLLQLAIRIWMGLTPTSEGRILPPKLLGVDRDRRAEAKRRRREARDEAREEARARALGLAQQREREREQEREREEQRQQEAEAARRRQREEQAQAPRHSHSNAGYTSNPTSPQRHADATAEMPAHIPDEPAPAYSFHSPAPAPRSDQEDSRLVLETDFGVSAPGPSMRPADSYSRMVHDV